MTTERYREKFDRFSGSPEGEGWEFGGVHDDGHTLSVEIRGPKKLTLRWRSPAAYRVIDEAARMRQQGLLPTGPSLVYIVDDSVFLEELWRLSNEALRDQSHRHYLVWTENQCVDVVAGSAPEIS